MGEATELHDDWKANPDVTTSNLTAHVQRPKADGSLPPTPVEGKQTEGDVLVHLML